MFDSELAKKFSFYILNILYPVGKYLLIFVKEIGRILPFFIEYKNC